jgi:serine/threonine-protein kinase
LDLGVVLGDRYRLNSRVAAGGMGEVWRAEDTVLGRIVAVKVIRPGLSGDPGFLHRFRAEARNTASLSHPGIATVHDYGETLDPAGGTRAFLVMELVDGEPLSTVLDRGRLEPSRAMDMLAQTARALHAAHQAGVVHRDVKPGNLLVRADGSVVVTDFGIARAMGAAGMTATGQVLGTAAYISPEQAAGQPATPASDVYSLGVVGYQMLSGHKPFEGENPLTVALAHMRQEPPPLPEDLPVAARAVVERSLAKEPTLRFASAAEMSEAARAAAAAPHDSRLAAATTAMLGAAGLAGATQLLDDGGATRQLGHGAPTSPAQSTSARRYSDDYPGLGPGGDRRYDDTSSYGRSYDDYDGGPRHGRPGDRKGKGRKVGVAVLVGIVALLALGLGIFAAMSLFDNAGSPGGDNSPQASAATPSPSPQQSEETFDLVKSDYLGEDIDKVSRALKRKGLNVDAVQIDPESEDDEEDSVADLTPTKNLTAGSTVTVKYFGKQQPDSGDGDNGNQSTEPTDEPSDKPSSKPPSSKPPSSAPASQAPEGDDS